ncbi:nucleoside recognition domain protein [Methanohalobium evestigatum Z-7303]|uniref:Nucleoside recognition domain protein n=1 Tax=Methanohalobium evestigatum (strain ATCC BAA-1072 / DSM 3721 / NBRC 107634 / OCM 161 / Z-7303) TaxID=644295 RepID=D7E745_METEZ|nr:nucleoside recognition domain-containing protein [Methanohalobium evestigatum]ADI73669.1 nucleoside recognition domain protein [Methanohalobium evestigatum Z-7303]
MLTDALLLSFDYLSTIIPYMIAGVVLAELVVELGWVDKISFLVRPITGFVHLRKECGISFLTAFASPSAANASLKDLHDNELIDEKELIIASVLNSFPSIITHWRTLLPVLVPLLGTIGLIYVGILTLVGLLKTVIVALIGHFILDGSNHSVAEFTKAGKPDGFVDALKSSLVKSKKTLGKILVVTVPVTIFVFILMDIGVFDIVSQYLKSVSRLLPVPVNGLPVIAAQFASKIAGYTIAGNLLTGEVLSGKEILITLLISKILTSITGLRIIAPHYIGIFGPRLGMKTMLISFILRLMILIFITLLLLVFL